MRIRLLAALLALASLFTAPTASAQFIPERAKLFMAARYAELEVLVEKEIKDDPNPPSSKLLPLCAAYGKLKRYGKLFPCLERLDANIQRGDTAALDLEEMRKANPLLFGLATMGSVVIGGPDALKGDVRPWLPLIRAEAYTELRDYDKAIAAAQQAFAGIPTRWNEERSFRIYALTALGLSHAFAGKKDEAVKYAETLQDVSTSYPYSGLTNDKVVGVAKIYIALGDFKKAYDGLRSDSESVGLLLRGLGDVIGGGLTGMGGESLFTYQELPKRFMVVKTQLEVGEVKEAKEGYDALLAIPRVRGNGEIYWLLLYDRGRIAAAEGDLAAAVEFWRRAIEVIEEQRATINTEANKIGFVGDKQAVYRGLVAGLIDLNRDAEAFDYVERSKARALVDLLAGKKDFTVAAPNVEDIRKLLENSQQAETDALIQVTSAAAEPIQQRTLKVADARRALQEQAPELASLVAVSATPIGEIQKLLPPDEALVEYYYDDKTLYAFALSREQIRTYKLEVAGMEADVRALRDAIERPDSNDYLQPAQRLHSRLILPLNDFIQGKKLLFVAHGALHYLPFAALHDGTAFLLEKHALRFLPSASVIRYLRPTQAGGRAGILAFGNPDLGDSRMDLKFAQDEALEIVKKMPQSRALLRKEATEAAYRQYAAGFSTLHFATHGEFRSDAPLSSALMLAKDGDSDGLLTVSKLYSTKIAADLVTLSACETGLGKVASGDDVVGLTRGFLYAGASTIVASLWKVDDRGTSALMTRFYDELNGGSAAPESAPQGGGSAAPEPARQGGVDKREALRKAQLASRAQFPHPFFWAAFQLTGQAN